MGLCGVETVELEKGCLFIGLMNGKKWEVCNREDSQRSVQFIRYINYSSQFAKITSFRLKKKDHGLSSVVALYLCGICFMVALVPVTIAAEKLVGR